MIAQAEPAEGLVLTVAASGFLALAWLLGRQLAGRPVLSRHPGPFAAVEPRTLLWAALTVFFAYQVLGWYARGRSPAVGAVVIALALGLGYLVHATLLRRLLRPSGSASRRAAQGLLVFWASLPVVLGLLYVLQLLGQEGQQEDVGRLVGREAGWEVLAAFAVIVAPVVEEIIFRGLLYPALRRIRGPRFALVVTSVLFGLIHWPPVVWAPLAVLGVFLGWLVDSTGSLLPCIVAHMAFNGLMVAQILL